MNRHRPRAALLTVVLSLASGCGFRAPGDSIEVTSEGAGPLPTIPVRRFTVIHEGCEPNEVQSRALDSAGMRASVGTVVLVCPSAGPDGPYYPVRADERAGLERTVQRLHAQGYRVHLAMGLWDGAGHPYSPAQSSAMLAMESWRRAVVAWFLGLPGSPEGFELALPVPLANGSREDVSALVRELSTGAHPGRTVGVFTPPSLARPSDLPGGDAYDLAVLATEVDHVRLMTVDFSTCFPPPFCVTPPRPGPSAETGWAVDALRFAMAAVPASRLDLTLPLYGHDFGTDPATHSVHVTAQGPDDYVVDHLEALALAAYHRSEVFREPSGVRHFEYTSTAGVHREVWFDDRLSLFRAQAAWTPPTVPAEVGITFYGVGSEDPGLWNALPPGRRP